MSLLYCHLFSSGSCFYISFSSIIDCSYFVKQYYFSLKIQRILLQLSPFCPHTCAMVRSLLLDVISRYLYLHYHHQFTGLMICMSLLQNVPEPTVRCSVCVCVSFQCGLHTADTCTGNGQRFSLSTCPTLVGRLHRLCEEYR